MMSNEEVVYKVAPEQLRTGKSLFGKEGALAPMLGCILNAALEGKLDARLSGNCCESGNRRNGKMSKAVQTQYGEISVAPPDVTVKLYNFVHTNVPFGGTKVLK